MRNKIKNFYFSPTLSPEAFLARGFLTGAATATVIGIVLLLLGIK